METVVQIAFWSAVGGVLGVFMFALAAVFADAEPTSERDAKRFNESVRYLAGALNSLAVATIAGATIVPLLNDRALSVWFLAWIALGFILHLVGHAVFGLLKRDTGYDG